MRRGGGVAPARRDPTNTNNAPDWTRYEDVSDAAGAAMLGFTMIVYIDYVLLAVLLFLTFFTCGYCFYRVRALHRNGQSGGGVFPRPTKVVLRGGGGLCTVVAYQNPLTGHYCVRKGRAPQTQLNPLQPAETSGMSPDSGLSAEYEPLSLEPLGPPLARPGDLFSHERRLDTSRKDELVKTAPVRGDNRVTKTWCWNYTEYQI